MTITSLEQAQLLLQEYKGPAEKFEIGIPIDGLSLRNQPVSLALAMAILTDQILAKGWWPNGFEEIEGVRHYRYSQ
jgi:hypothetical protein